MSVAIMRWSSLDGAHLLPPAQLEELLLLTRLSVKVSFVHAER